MTNKMIHGQVKMRQHIETIEDRRLPKQDVGVVMEKMTPVYAEQSAREEDINVICITFIISPMQFQPPLLIIHHFGLNMTSRLFGTTAAKHENNVIFLYNIQNFEDSSYCIFARRK